MRKEPVISNGQHHSPLSPSEGKSPWLDLSVIVISLNEAASLPVLFSSLPKGCEIILLDSGSTDDTCGIARAQGATVHSRPFDNYANQKNAALALATRSWVFSVDCDEELSPELREFIVRCCSQPENKRAFKVRRQLVFQGRSMRFGRTVDWPVRLFPRGQARFVGAVHESLELSGPLPTESAPGSLKHYSYRDLTDYLTKLNNLTTRVAAKHAAGGKPPPSFLFTALRPWAEFFIRYVVKLGFLDGRQGFIYAYLSATYAFMKMAKRYEAPISRESIAP